MDAALIERIETSAGRGASALFAAAMAYAAYGFLLAVGVLPEVGVCAASAGSLAYLPCSRLLGAAASVSPGFDLPAFELRDLEFSDAMDELLLTDAIRPGSPGELILTDADRLDGSEPLLLDDILAKIDAGARVVRLFDRKAMPTPGQLQSRIATHLGEASPVDVPTDAAQALSDALAELRRSLG